MSLRSKERINCGQREEMQWEEGGGPLDFSVKEEDIEMAGIIV